MKNDNIEIIDMTEPKINGKDFMSGFLGGIFYVYLFLISAPVFVYINSGGIAFANYVMGIRQGFTVNSGFLILPVFALLIGLRLFTVPKLKTGYFGKLIIAYCCVCFMVMLYGQLQEIKLVRLFLFGQVMTPFIAYFYLLNFAKHIKFDVAKKILIFSLLVQFVLSLYFNYQLSGLNLFDSSVFFLIGGKKIHIYGAYDYYPILFLTLVIFFHGSVNNIKDPFKRNAFIVLTIILYAYGLTYHSRNSLISLVFLFVFYLFKRGRERAFFRFFVWLVGIGLILSVVYPRIIYQSSSITRIMSSAEKITSYLSNKTETLDKSTKDRIDAQLNSLKVIKEDPLAGVAYAWPYAAHNQYLSVLGISGIVSFSIFMLLLWLIYKRLKRDFLFFKQRRWNTQMVGAMLGIFVLFVVSSLFQNNFTVTYTSWIFWAMMGLYEIHINDCKNLSNVGGKNCG